MIDSRRILVIDDEPDIVELIRYNLSKEGFAVSTAPDGEEALRSIKKGDFALIILDLMLPGIQGMELCRILKKDPKTENLPIIMLTAQVEEVDRLLGLESGADDYITKTVQSAGAGGPRQGSAEKSKPEDISRKYSDYRRSCG